MFERKPQLALYLTIIMMSEMQICFVVILIPITKVPRIERMSSLMYKRRC